MASKQIALIGGDGGMGLRYRAIMDHMEIPYLSLDKDDWQGVNIHKDDLHSILIASPTDQHFWNLTYVKDLGLPILCEKPICKNSDDLLKLLNMDLNLKMVNQYAYLVDPRSSGESYYNFFKTGKDGLAWDCISIIALSERRPLLMNTSPIWSCAINGHEINIRDMDQAYCKMIADWWRKPEGDLNYIAKAHDKVLNGFYRT